MDVSGTVVTSALLRDAPRARQGSLFPSVCSFKPSIMIGSAGGRVLTMSLTVTVWVLLMFEMGQESLLSLGINAGELSCDIYDEAQCGLVKTVDISLD
ncbi:hypothetical protein BgiBS90_024032 [Biomphalaria glabrata]|nr:hypothetical protein BgiBS90_024032 [Biomphalaria glabrata]